MLGFHFATSTSSLRPRFAVRGSLWAVLRVGLAVCCGASRALAEPPSQQPSLKIGYLAELPISWRTGLADPLRNIARSLGTAFARPVDPEIPLPADNIFGAESWEEFSRTIQLGTNQLGSSDTVPLHLFPIQGYEMVEHGRALNLKPLLLATRNGRWQTRFLLLSSSSAKIQSLHDLKERTILIHRDGCGNLVDFWLDMEIAVRTGVPRKSFARYQTVTQAREAVLPVFFGEADACVVSETAYLAVCAQNPAQIAKKLNLTLATSEEMPAQVVACKIDLPVDLQRRVLDCAPQLSWEFGKQTGGFIPAEELAFDHLRKLLEQRAHPTTKPATGTAPAPATNGIAAGTPPVRPSAVRLQTSTPGSRR